ncbi:Efflux pump FUB11 [Vanrija pseudolonga]|uniref:Efflux pump FUB11 n=1 Tax=Vanrija pseudolonga TaxID=143232 RepID=A0AAF0YJU4_9TREE|nr:Efflux pump FUB11 [Vanrija pseudolonga]
MSASNPDTESKVVPAVDTVAPNAAVDASPIVVSLTPDDPEHPANFSPSKKALNTAIAAYVLFLTAIMATSVGVMTPSGMAWFGVSRTAYALSLTVYMVPMAVFSLVFAPLSEVWGRAGVYRVAMVVNTLAFIPQIWTHSYPALLVTRFIQGTALAAGNALVGGTIADMYAPRERGLAMNMMALANYAGNSLGGAAFGFVAMKLGVQWCYGIQALACVVSVVLNYAFMVETRAEAIAARKAARLTASTGRLHVGAHQLEAKSLAHLARTAVLRPLTFLCTEPIVTAMSLWIGFAWSCIYLGSSATLAVFGQYGWNAGLTGLSLLSTLVGGLLGFASNFHQERIYRRAVASGAATPEVRLYWSASGGLLFPACMYAYAWTGRPSVPWIVPAIFLSGAMWGVYIMYCGVVNYFADAYETYSSSAQAAHSFVRGFMAGTLPLAAGVMYNHLGYPQASTLVASISTALAAAPLALIFVGPKLRARSKTAVAIAGSWGQEWSDVVVVSRQ